MVARQILVLLVGVQILPGENRRFLARRGASRGSSPEEEPARRLPKGPIEKGEDGKRLGLASAGEKSENKAAYVLRP